MKPTLEKFTQLVKEKLCEYLPNLSEEQLDDYLNSEDAQDAIKEEYELSSEQLENGEITETIFLNGSVSAVANCLYMLY